MEDEMVCTASSRRTWRREGEREAKGRRRDDVEVEEEMRGGGRRDTTCKLCCLHFQRSSPRRTRQNSGR